MRAGRPHRQAPDPRAEGEFAALAAGRRLLGSIWIVATAAVLPIAVFAFLVAQMVVDAQRKEVEQRYDAIATAMLTAIDVELLNEVKALQMLAADPRLGSGDLRVFHAYLREVLRTQDNWFLVSLNDSETGTQILNTIRSFDSPTRPSPMAEQNRVVAAEQTPWIGPIQPGNGSVTTPYIPIKVPVVRDGIARLVLSAAISPKRIRNFIHAQMFSKNYRVTVLDINRRIVARSNNDETAGQPASQLVQSEIAELAGSRPHLFRGLNREGEDFLRLVKTSERSGWHVVVGETARSYDASITRTLGWIAAAGGGAMVLSASFAVVLGIRFGNRMSAHERRRREETERARLTAVQAEEEARRAKATADKASQAKSRLFAAASHDLRQPLQAMSLFLDVLRPRIKKDPERTALENLDTAQKAATDLLNSLLDVAKLDAGILVPQRTTFLAREVVTAVAAECLPLATQKGLRLKTRCGNLAIVSDRLMLGRILRNLVMNAIRYTDQGSILVACRRRGDMAMVEVWDSGSGIPPDKTDLIWEEFYQIDNEARDRSRGLGLGLSIVQRLAQTLGHTVSVRSRYGQGSVFAVAVPVAPGAAAPADGPVTRTAQ